MPDPQERPRVDVPRMNHADPDVVARLRAGDETAFARLLEQHSAAMLRVASMHLPRAAAEDVVQDTWLAVIEGIDRFEARSSLKTWLFSILMNRLRTRAQRDRRSVPFSALVAEEPAESSVDPSRFLPADHAQWPHHWAVPPKSWGESPENRLLARETQQIIQQTIDALPPAQKHVITLVDVEGWEPTEVCQLLSISGINQRVLLHRARSRVRRALEQYFEEA